MKKAELQILFPTVSPTAIHDTGGSYEIIGKFCSVVVFENGKIDLMLRDTSDPEKGLSKRKLKSLLSVLEVPTKSSFSDQTKKPIAFTLADGEAWINLELPDLILNNLKVLGIRKKRKVTSTQKQSLAKRLNGEAA